MHREVAAYVGRCEVFDCVRSSFNTLLPLLKPLPIVGLGYRWSLEFCGSIAAYITTREVRTGDGRTFQQMD